MDLEDVCPRKKAKVAAPKKPNPPRAPESAEAAESGSHDRWGGRGRGEAGPSSVVAGKAPREPSIRDLCRLPAGPPNDFYHARLMGELSEGQPSDRLVARWGGLTRGTWVWADGETAAAFVRGGLHPDLAREMYTLPSDVLLGKSVKSLLWVSVLC